MNELSLNIIDIIQNSISAGASHIKLTVEEDQAADLFRIVIADNGRGMSAEEVGRLADPFFTTRTTRKVGMGIPLFRQSAEQAGGALTVDSGQGRGTTVTATFGHSHLDRPPLGDLANSFVLMVAANPGIDFVLRYIFNGNQYCFDTVEVRTALEDIPINKAQVVKMLDEMVAENIKGVCGIVS